MKAAVVIMEYCYFFYLDCFNVISLEFWLFLSGGGGPPPLKSIKKLLSQFFDKICSNWYRLVSSRLEFLSVSQIFCEQRNANLRRWQNTCSIEGYFLKKNTREQCDQMWRNFATFANKLKFWQFGVGYLIFGKILNLPKYIFMLLGEFLLFVNGQILNK